MVVEWLWGGCLVSVYWWYNGMQIDCRVVVEWLYSGCRAVVWWCVEWFVERLQSGLYSGV